MRYAAKTDIGRLRNLNEDSYLVDGDIFAVADGMGGHRAGEVASSLALNVFKAAFEKPRPDESDDDIKSRLKEAVARANQAVFERSRSARELAGMGTTLTAAVPADGKVHIVHVGDSRALLIRKGKMTPVTSDHTLVGEMLLRREVTSETARIHPLRHILTRALGTERDIRSDQTILEVQTGDRLLLCTDGLYASVENRDIAKAVGGKDLESACGKLVDLANLGGGEDNVTVILVEF